MTQTTQPLPILFLITGLGRGGAETQLVRLVTHLDRSRWRPIVVTLMGTNVFQGLLSEASIEVISLDMQRGRPTLGAFWRTVRVIRQYRPQVLVSFMYHAILLGRIAGRLTGVPQIISSIRTERVGGSLREWLLRVTDPLAVITTTNSERVAAYLRAHSIVHPDRLRVIPNALAEFVPALAGTEILQREVSLASDGFTWLAVGRLDPAKDYPTLIRAFSLVAAQDPETKLLVAGRGDPTPLVDLANQLGVAERVAFLGERGDVWALLNLSHGFVLASAWEGLPNALMEAQASGTPAVATEVGGVSELIESGVTGLLVPPRDPGALAGAMLQLMQMAPADRERMGQAAQQRVLATYGLDRVMSEWEALFDEVS